MGKYNLVIYITVAVALLVLISRTSHKSNPQSHLRRLKFRTHYPFAPPADPHIHHDPQPAFDPIVSEIELRREDREWEHLYSQKHHHHESHTEPAPAHESQPELEGFANAEEYLNDEASFNFTRRLMLLFPKIDVDPADGFVSESELIKWNLKQSRKEAMHRSHRELYLHDRNEDGLVSFAEYEAPSWARIAENTSFGYDFGWWKEDHFNASDTNGDAHLNLVEFNDFLHPADTTNPKLLNWLCEEEIRERDKDKDGMVNFQEFFHGIFDLVRNYEDTHDITDESDDSLEAPAKMLFARLDTHGTGYLSAVDLLPIIGKLHPPEQYYAKQQASHMLHQADLDKDGLLTLTEMIESPYVFYTGAFAEDDDSDRYEVHDEFR